MMRVLDLFSGIGGFSLGLERTGGFKTVAFCEIEPFCRRVLAKHWPEVPCYDDVRTLTAERLAADGIAVDVICGGFPCQDISHAGKGAGIEGERSGLWSEIARLAGELRPRYVIVENVSALLGRGLGVVLGDLAEIGFDAEWHCIPASAVGAPHRRDRWWCVAHAQCTERGPFHRACHDMAGEIPASQWQESPSGLERGCSHVADAEVMQCNGSGVHGGCDGQGCRQSGAVRQPGGSGEAFPDTGCANVEGQRPFPVGIGTQLGNVGNDSWWSVEPDVGRVAHGVPQRVDRLKALGNAVVPQIPELIGRAILASQEVAA